MTEMEWEEQKSINIEDPLNKFLYGLEEATKKSYPSNLRTILFHIFPSFGEDYKLREAILKFIKQTT
jgi:hypothetical protein